MNIHRLTLILATLSTLTLLSPGSAHGRTVYVGNSLTLQGFEGADQAAPLVILGEYNPAGPSATASASTTLQAGIVQDVKFYGQNFNFTLYALSRVAGGPGNQEQTFRVVASQSFSNSVATPGVQTLAVSGFSVAAGDLLAFAGVGPYYPQTANDATNSDATYEDSSRPDSFAATPPGGPGTVFTVGPNPDTNANYEYVSDAFRNQGRTYAIGVDVVPPAPPTNTFLPVYRVTQAGATLSQAANLAVSLGLSPGRIGWNNGRVSFIDPTNFMAVPSLILTDTNNPAISNLLAGTQNPYPAIPLKVQALDFQALTDLAVFDTNQAFSLTSNALAAAGLTPQFATPRAGHTGLIAFKTNADTTVTWANQYLDTLVSYQFALPGDGTNHYPLIGPGARVVANYGPTGNVTHLIYAAPQLTAGPSVQIISPTEAGQRAAALLPTNAQISVGLVYLAPPFSPPPASPACTNCPPTTWHPTNLIPYYAFSGTLNVTNPVTGSNTTTTTQTQLIPGTDDTNYVPAIQLSASQVGAQLVASVAATGGSPPYSYLWSGSSPSVSSNFGPSVSYTPVTRVGPPPLAIALDPSNSLVYVSWPYPSTGFVLESKSNLLNAVWSQVSATVQTNAGSKGINVAALAATGNLFLRLRLASPTLRVNETVGVTVTDANGVSIHTHQTLAVQAQPVPLAPGGPGDPPSFGTESPYANSPYGNAGFDSDTGGWRNNMLGSSLGGVESFFHLGLNSLPGDFIGGEHYAINYQGLPGGAVPTPIYPSSSYGPDDLGALLALPIFACADVVNSGINTVNLLYYLGHGETHGFTFTVPGNLTTDPEGEIVPSSLSLTSPIATPGAAQFNYVPIWGDGVVYSFSLAETWGNNPATFSAFQGLIADGYNFPPWPGALNWMVFDGCRVLQFNAATANQTPPPSGPVPDSTTDPVAWQYWGPLFNGLHFILGFHTVGVGGAGTAGAFANSMLTPGTSIMQAWFSAVLQTQPPTVPPNSQGVPVGGPIVAAALGPFGPMGISDSGDCYPGVPGGSIGPSISPAATTFGGSPIPSQITGWWYMYVFQAGAGQ